jgi:serine/threonine protein kinase
MDLLKPGDPGRVGSYRLIGRLGEGGMGRVYLGLSPGGRQVAVKVIHPSHASDKQFRERFAREIEAARRVGGFHTASVVDADPGADPPWMVTAYIQGRSLQDTVREGGPLPADQICTLGAGLAEGLAAIHACGLVHRDLKPSNVILAEDGPRIIDFGIARAAGASAMTTAGVVVGTYSYMSPEQVEGHVAGPESDVFALGCTLAYAATAHSPFGDESIAMVVHRIASEPPNLDGVPETHGLRQLISECLAKSPGERPSVSAIMTRLSEDEDDVATPAAAPGSGDWWIAGPPDRQAGISQPGISQPGASQPGAGQPGAGQVGTSQPGASQQAAPPPSVVSGERYEPATFGGRDADQVIPTPPLGMPYPQSSTPGSGGDAFPNQQAQYPNQQAQYPNQPPQYPNQPPQYPNQPAQYPSQPPQYPDQIVAGQPGGGRRRRGVLIASGVGVIVLIAAILGVLLSGHSKPTHVATGPTTPHPTVSPTIKPPTQPEATLHDPSGKDVFDVAFGSNTVLATGDSNYNTYLWNLTDNSLTATLHDKNSNGVNGVAYSPNAGIFAAADASGDIYLWDASTGGLTATLTNPNGKANDSVEFSPDGGFVAAGNQDGSTYLWDVATGKLNSTPSSSLHDPNGKNVYGIAFSQEGGLLATGDTNGNTYLWNFATGKLVSTFHDPNSNGGLYDVAFSPDGSLLAVSDYSTATSTGVVYLWNVSTGKMTATLQTAAGGSYGDVAFSQNGKVVAVADTNGSVIMWKVATGKLIASLRDPSHQALIGVAFSPDGNTLAVSDTKGDTYLWNVKFLGP